MRKMIWLGNRTRLSIQSVYRIEWKSHSFVFLVCTSTWLPISRPTDFSTALRGRQRCTAFRRTPPTGSACSSPPRSAPSNPPPRPSGPATTSLHSSAANSAPATRTHRVPCSRPCPQTHCTPSPAHTSPRATTRRIPCP